VPRVSKKEQEEQERLARTQERLRTDTPYYAQYALQIVGPGGVKVPLVAKKGQLDLDRALERQRAEGKLMRAISLKARKVGISTWTQGKIIQRVTQRPNHHGLVVAHDNSTAGKLFDIGSMMVRNLPPDLQPEINGYSNSQTGLKYISFGTKSRAAQFAGDVGLNSSLHIDTAKEAEAGRGDTIRSMHLSEVAFWPHVAKMTALLNSVPDEPDTLIVVESTAKGQNHFKLLWDEAVSGASGYAPVFSPWWEEDAYSLPFDTPEDREEFVAGVGEGRFGEDEPRLVERFGCTPEQLAWRRRTIVAKCESKVEVFKQEYPASPEEAFKQTGKHVFSIVLISRVIDRTDLTDPLVPGPENPGPDIGVIRAKGTKQKALGGGRSEDVPTGALWVPRAESGLPSMHPFWRAWEMPQPKAQYLVAADVAGGEEDTVTEDLAFHAAQVIDHHTGMQVAEYESRCDPDVFADELFLVGLLFNEATIAVEVTGGWGLPVVKRLNRRGYRRLYSRKKAQDASLEKYVDRLGWDTNRQTKPFIEAGMHELLREGTHGLRSRLTAGQLATYVRAPNGRTGPDGGTFSDRLMAYMIVKHIAREVPPRSEHVGAGPLRMRGAWAGGGVTGYGRH
jgi:hypothetical protein